MQTFEAFYSMFHEFVCFSEIWKDLDICCFIGVGTHPLHSVGKGKENAIYCPNPPNTWKIKKHWLENSTRMHFWHLPNNTEEELHFAGPGCTIRIISARSNRTYRMLPLWRRQHNRYTMCTISPSPRVQRSHLMSIVRVRVWIPQHTSIYNDSSACNIQFGWVCTCHGLICKLVQLSSERMLL